MVSAVRRRTADALENLQALDREETILHSLAKRFFRLGRHADGGASLGGRPTGQEE